MYHWLLLESLHFGIKLRQCVLNGVKLTPSTLMFQLNTLEYISQTKYLGFMFNTNAQDDEDMLRQMRTLYIRSNKLLRTFHYCSTDVKLELFKSYCTSFYCCYL